MKKKLNFVLSLILALAICISAVVTPASSFQNDVVTSSYAMLMINLDTRTIVYSSRADKVWNASYQGELMTYLILYENVDDLQSVTVRVDEDFIDELEYSDGCLDQYVGYKLTLKDLAAIMLLTSGSDAAYLIADYVGGGSVDGFVKMMNDRAAQIGCKKTAFLSPGYCESKEHYTTCLDLSRIYNRLLDNDLYNEIMSSPTYIPERFGDNDDYAVTTENSIMNPQSPYYFRYATGGKFAYDKVSGASLSVTTSYQEMGYLFIALRGKNEAEENVFTDARRQTIWAYLNLSDRKVVDTDVPVDTVTAVSDWGEYSVPVYADNSARKTLPKEYDQKKFSVKMSVPDTLDLPLLQGQKVGTAQIFYDGERLDKVNIVPNRDEGLSMIHDLGKFGGYAIAKMFPESGDDLAIDYDDEELEAETPTKAPKKPAATKAPAEKSKSAKTVPTAASEEETTAAEE